MTERRAVARQRTFLKGVLSFQKGTSSEDCVVRNLSDLGAQIELPHPLAPDAGDLLIPVRSFRAAARVAWRNGARVGFKFEQPYNATLATAPASRPRLRDEGY